MCRDNRFIVTLCGRWLLISVCNIYALVSTKSPLGTKVAIVLLDWPKFKAVTNELKLIEQLPKWEKVSMRTTPTCTYEPSDNITFAWVIDYRLIDAKTHVFHH